ncbi:MAG: UPF0489 family protein [Frankiaceae bacterium]|nr:UPF0489 family protein [Frankiaceae bacterium]
MPGFVTENHGELFLRWREAIEAGMLVPPFHVTHVDAHADLGLGDAGYTYVLSELLFENPEDRTQPRFGFSGLNDGNHLIFAIACRWITDLVYVYGEGGGGDELAYVMEDFGATRPHRNVQLAAMRRPELEKLIHRSGSPPDVSHLEPPVPYASTRWEQFQADVPYDFICLTHSPPFTPESADPLFAVIRDQLIEPI